MNHCSPGSPDPIQAPALSRDGWGGWIVIVRIALGASLLAGCSRARDERLVEDASRAGLPTGDPWFQDVTEEIGLRFHHESSARGQYLMPEQIGSGAAFIDYDRDGLLDLYLVQNGDAEAAARNQLFHQDPDGRFRNVSQDSGADIIGRGMGVAVGDVNNDGWVDLLVTEFGGLRLLLNRTNGSFREITAVSGLDNPQWAVAASFFDYDRDGWLDLAVGNYLDYDPTHQCYDAAGGLDYCGPHGAPLTVSRLFRNRGADRWKALAESEFNPASGPLLFQDVTVPSGWVRHPGHAMGIVCADFDGDRWPDVLLADDELPNRLFRNQGDGTFAEEAAARGLAFTVLGQVAANMGIGLSDVNEDGLFDIFITHLTDEFHNLWVQGPRGWFQDRTAQLGLTQSAWRGTGFGAVMADFNHDGAPDIALVNGRIKRDRSATQDMDDVSGVDPFWRPYAQRAQLFANRNNAQGIFEDISLGNSALCGTPMVGRGLACGDVDNDGDLDLLFTAIGGSARLLRNSGSTRGNWLMIRAIDPSLGGRDAYGAEVRVIAGPLRRWGMVQPVYSYLCSNDPRVHFGLGAVSQVDEILILWPDGVEETFEGGEANRFLVLEKGRGKRGSSDIEPRTLNVER